jgi:uncharacterized protein
MLGGPTTEPAKMPNPESTRTPLAVAPPPPAVTGHVIGKASWTMLMNRLAADDAEHRPPFRPFQAPQLPPGVVPARVKHCLAMDNATQMYGYLNEGPMCGLGFPGYPYLSNLVQRSEYRAPTEVISGEMTREWIGFTGVKGPKLKELEQAFLDFNVRECVRDCLTYDGQFGKGHLGIQIKGQDSDRKRQNPLLVDDDGVTIQKGALLGFKPIEPTWVTPYAYNSNDPMLPDFYAPDAYYVMGKRTHASRLLTFISRPVPDLLKPSYNFGGLSLSQLIEPYVQRWLKTVDSVNRLISNFSIISLKTNMMSSISEGGDGGVGLFDRLAFFARARDNRGIFAVDKEQEELESLAVPLSGLSELQAQAQEHMAAPTHIPLVKLTGITPSGLNASSDGEIKVFYDFIGSEQQNQIAPTLRIILRIIQLHLWGKVDPKIGFEFLPLDSPTDKEMADMRKADGDRDVGYVTAGVVSPDEVRDRLRNDPNSGYTGLEGDAPPPPEQDNAEHGAQLEEKGKQRDHERGEESAEAGAKREAEAREHQAKLDAKQPKGKKS